MSLRLRLNLLIAILLLLFMVMVGSVMIKGAKTSTQEGVEAATRVTTQLLDTVIVSSVQNPEWGYTHDVMQRFLQSLGHVRSSDIRLYDMAGVLLYQSPPSTYRANETPPQWFITWLTPHEKTVTRFIYFGKLEVIPNPLGSIREAWSKFKVLFWIGMAFFIFLNALVYWMLGRWLSPLHPILKAINQMEAGDLATRLPTFRLPEFERIGHSLNRMAESLGAERELEENRQLTQLIQSHIEDERRSLARELHDELGQYVTAIKTFAVTINNKTQKESPTIAHHAQMIIGVANQIYDGMHDIIRQLRPGALDNLGLSETLRDAVHHWQRQYPQIQFQLSLEGVLDQLGETLNINLYRIVQEGVNNAIKHAQANAITVKLALSAENHLQLSIHDNGVGMNLHQEGHRDHFGLLGIRERVQALYGHFDLASEPNVGTTLYVDIPQEAQFKLRK